MMALLFLILCCFLIMLDAWLTNEGILEGATELNPIRALLIRVLGLEVGTYGVSAAICAGLIYSWWSVSADSTKLFSYASLSVIYGVTAVVNIRNLRRGGIWRK